MKRTLQAFTLAELVIAMSIMTIIGLSIAGVSMALSTAYASGQDYYTNIQTGRSAMMRILKELNKAKLITGIGPHTLVYWAADTNADGGINLSELTVLDYEADSEQLKKLQVVFPDYMDPQIRQALDESLTLASAIDVVSVKNLIASNPRFVGQVLAGNVSAFDVCVYPDCPKAKLVTIKIKIGAETESITLRSAAALRASKVDHVGISDNQYVLMTDPIAP